MSSFIAMSLFALVTSISPGPVNIVATSSGANFGFQRTLPHITGATIGFTSMLVLIGMGVVNILGNRSEITGYLCYVGAAFLLYISYKIAFAPINNQIEKKQAKPPTLLEGLLCQWLNPKAWIVAISGISVFAPNGESDSSLILLFSLTFFVVCFLSISVWAAIGITIQKLLKHPKHYQVFNLAMGGLLASTVFYLMLFLSHGVK